MLIYDRSCPFDWFQYCDKTAEGRLGLQHVRHKAIYGARSVYVCSRWNWYVNFANSTNIGRVIKFIMVFLFYCRLSKRTAGYSFPVDWWSLGVVAYEMRANTRPFVIHSNTALVEVKNTLNAPVHYPRYWSNDFIDLLTKVGAGFFFVLYVTERKKLKMQTKANNDIFL